MITIENVDVYGVDVAVRAMRNSFDSWEKSDGEYETFGHYELGDADKALMRKLIRNGDSHAKFMRFVTVTCDITAPRYWWTEFDTYKVGTVRCSCSTMHTITRRPFTMDDFSTDGGLGTHNALAYVVCTLNIMRERYLETGDKAEWRALIQLLPQSYNQRATVELNYQVLRNICRQRKGHRLSEWAEFIGWVKKLPYAEELIICENM